MCEDGGGTNFSRETEREREKEKECCTGHKKRKNKRSEKWGLDSRYQLDMALYH